MTIDDALAMSPDNDRLQSVHALYREILEAIHRGVDMLRELDEEHAAGALESWGHGLDVHGGRHMLRMLRKDHRP